jgi:hypothetical protein
MALQCKNLIAAGVAVLSLLTWSCTPSHQPLQVKPRPKPLNIGPVDTGAGSLEATRRALGGTWTLLSLEVVDADGSRRPVKASGQLQYDPFGNMTVRGVIEDSRLPSALVLDYTGRIVIDVAHNEFYPADLVSDLPADPSQITSIAPDKVRRYQLTADAFVVTYVDGSANPTAVATWRRSASQ